NTTFPTERTLQMVLRARLKRLIVEGGSFELFLPVLEQLREPICVLVPDTETLKSIPNSCVHHQYLTRRNLVDAKQWIATEPNSQTLAYLLFTSGSTGQPKGVMVTQRNVMHFVDCMVERYDITEQDRFSQTFDLTFDLSAFDMFVAWEKGACLCCPTQGEKLLPGNYIKSQSITIWFSVPSTAIMMKKLRMLKPDAYPTIRYSLFCGEALPLEVAEAFQQAAPNSVVENLYGPTELTIASTLYRYETDEAEADSQLGVVPIGNAYPAMTEMIVDEDLNVVKPGEVGELLMTGPQLSKGYWEDPEKTAAAFVVPPGQTEVFYRTGDRVKRRRAGGPLLYLGRVDDQIKVQGYRVELGEIEALIREAARTDVAIAVGYPAGINGADGILAFMSKTDIDTAEIEATIRNNLPAYMQPTSLVHVDTFPLNSNGKVDRRALLENYLASQPDAAPAR
ncbi:MAG: AMP-binding protein, partial [Gammaproteobacteria bacterium]|nr:AMP-binding protein [Gammaproteobacteria bacterium]